MPLYKLTERRLAKRKRDEERIEALKAALEGIGGGEDGGLAGVDGSGSGIGEDEGEEGEEGEEDEDEDEGFESVGELDSEEGGWYHRPCLTI